MLEILIEHPMIFLDLNLEFSHDLKNSIMSVLKPDQLSPHTAGTGIGKVERIFSQI